MFYHVNAPNTGTSVSRATRCSFSWQRHNSSQGRSWLLSLMARCVGQVILVAFWWPCANGAWWKPFVQTSALEGGRRSIIGFPLCHCHCKRHTCNLCLAWYPIHGWLRPRIFKGMGISYWSVKLALWKYVLNTWCAAQFGDKLNADYIQGGLESLPCPPLLVYFWCPSVVQFER